MMAGAALLFSLLLAGCAAQKQTVEYGPPPPMRDVMNYLDYLGTRLNLTDAQRQQVYEILAKAVDGAPRAMREAYHRGNPWAVRDAMKKRMKEMNKAMKGLLSKKQYKEYKRILKEQEDLRRDRMRDMRNRRPGGMGAGGGF